MLSDFRVKLLLYWIRLRKKLSNNTVFIPLNVKAVKTLQ